MELESLKKETEQKMKHAIQSLGDEFKRVRTGRAQVSMLDGIRVDYYGNLTPLNQVASVSCPDARSFIITPWESSVLKAIETSIVKSEIGMAPINDGKIIRLKLPELTEDRRKDLVKKTKKMVEDGRIAVRMARREANDLLKQLLKDKKISEDENKTNQDFIQKMTDKFITDLDKIAVEKEKDIMTL
jgi:ribosome recycling factor